MEIQRLLSLFALFLVQPSHSVPEWLEKMIPEGIKCTPHPKNMHKISLDLKTEVAIVRLRGRFRTARAQRQLLW